MMKLFVTAAFLLVLALRVDLPVEALSCFNCSSKTETNCSTEEALNQNISGSTKDCSFKRFEWTCFVETTYINETMVGFRRGCANPGLCSFKNLTRRCTILVEDTKCIHCCPTDYCNTKVHIKSPYDKEPEVDRSSTLKSTCLLSMMFVFAMFLLLNF